MNTYWERSIHTGRYIEIIPGSLTEARNDPGYMTMKERRVWFTQQFANRKCVLCGESERICLLFHHVDPLNKIDSIAPMVKEVRCKIPTIQREIDKCVVVCRNCHARLHHPSYYN